LKPGCEHEHDDDRHDREQGVADAEPAVRQSVTALELEDDDHPHTPELTEGPIAGQQRGDGGTPPVAVRPMRGELLRPRLRPEFVHRGIIPWPSNPRGALTPNPSIGLDSAHDGWGRGQARRPR